MGRIGARDDDDDDDDDAMPLIALPCNHVVRPTETETNHEVIAETRPADMQHLSS